MRYNRPEETIQSIGRKETEMDQLIYIIVGIAIPLALLLSFVLAMELKKMFGVANLYRAPARDLRFICSLLLFFTPGGKWRILRNPCLLTDQGVASPRADVVVIGGGGVMILTVDQRKGHFTTPAIGPWTIWEDGKGVRIPNRFIEGRQYVSAIHSILVKNSITCPVFNHVVLSDDYAMVDDLYNENVYTGAQLVPYVKHFCNEKVLSKKDQMRLREAIAAHHRRCRQIVEGGASAEAAAPAQSEQ